MTQTAQVRSIAFTYAPTGEVTCSNTAGLTFFLFAEAPGVKPSAEAAPSRPAPGWTQVEATMEVAVRRAAEPQAIAEIARVAPVPAASFTPMEATQEVLVRCVPVAEPPAPMQPAPVAVAPAQSAQKGWFGRLFAKAQ